jgi:hypothetical protein
MGTNVLHWIVVPNWRIGGYIYPLLQLSNAMQYAAVRD